MSGRVAFIVFFVATLAPLLGAVIALKAIDERVRTARDYSSHLYRDEIPSILSFNTVKGLDDQRYCCVIEYRHTNRGYQYRYRIHPVNADRKPTYETSEIGEWGNYSMTVREGGDRLQEYRRYYNGIFVSEFLP